MCGFVIHLQGSPVARLRIFLKKSSNAKSMRCGIQQLIGRWWGWSAYHILHRLSNKGFTDWTVRFCQVWLSSPDFSCYLFPSQKKTNISFGQFTTHKTSHYKISIIASVFCFFIKQGLSFIVALLQAISVKMNLYFSTNTLKTKQTNPCVLGVVYSKVGWCMISITPAKFGNQVAYIYIRKQVWCLNHVISLNSAVTGHF